MSSIAAMAYYYRMNIASELFGKITDLTATVIVAIALHVPFLLNALMTGTFANPLFVLKTNLSLEGTYATNDRSVPGKVEANGFYKGPTDCRKSEVGAIRFPPTGKGDRYTKEDVIVAGKQLCLFSGLREGDMPMLITLGPAIETGEGNAWFFREDEHKPAPEGYCKDTPAKLTPVVGWDVEVNEETGDVTVQESCGGAIFD